MIDIEKIVRQYASEAICKQIEEHEKLDQFAVAAVQNKESNNRQEKLRKWLNSYNVFQYFGKEDRIHVVNVVLEFVDALHRNTACQNSDSIITTCDRLNEACGMVAKKRKNGRSRDMTSLASKALWCRFPCDVPLYDSFSQRTLWQFSRLRELQPPAVTGSEYERFARIWFELYRIAKPVISSSDLRDYPYKVQIFDKILWIIGKPDYGVQAF